MATRVDALTGIRIVAAVLVFLSHLHPPDPLNDYAATFMAAGYNGVTLFFTLSGFVIAWNYVDRLARPSGRALWSYTVARLARIYPLYLFALLFASILAYVTRTLPEGAWLHVFALQAWSPDVTLALALNGPGWSIGVEFFLYACFPLLIIAIAPLRDRRAALLWLAAAAVVAVGIAAWWFTATGRGALPFDDPQSAHRWLYRTPATRLGDFVVGICAALLARNWRIRAGVATVVQIVSVTAFVVMMAWPAMLHSAWSWDFAYLLPSALLIWSLAASDRAPLGRLLATRPMVLAGEASFAFYLLHSPLLGSIYVDPGASLFGFLVSATVTFAMILCAAIGAHVAIERPARRMLSTLLDRRRPTRRAELDAAAVVPRERVSA